MAIELPPPKYLLFLVIQNILVVLLDFFNLLHEVVFLLSQSSHFFFVLCCELGFQNVVFLYLPSQDSLQVNIQALLLDELWEGGIRHVAIQE